jgi:hypothetical protein
MSGKGEVGDLYIEDERRNAAYIHTETRLQRERERKKSRR